MIDMSIELRAVEAAKNFLVQRDYKILDVFPLNEYIKIVSKEDNGTLHFCGVRVYEDYMPETDIDTNVRKNFEQDGVRWLAENLNKAFDCHIYFDMIDIQFISSGSALLRYHTNFLSIA